MYYTNLSELHHTLTEEAEKNMVRAIFEECDLEGSTEIQASGDGSWQRKGFSSKNGVVTLMGAKTGKALDFEVMTKVCMVCAKYSGPNQGPLYEEWLEAHQPNCTINHTGSSGAMEATGVVRIFERSLKRGGVKYKTYIGDGDSKTYPALVKAKPYGDNLIPEKVCMMHVVFMALKLQYEFFFCSTFGRLNVWAMSKNEWAPVSEH